MKSLQVHDQVRLGPVRCLGLSVTGMSYRLFRSVVTVAILGLAVAFLIHMIGYGLIAHDTRLLAHAEMQDSRLLGEWVARLSNPDSEDQILAALGGMGPVETARRQEYQGWGALDQEDLRHGETVAQQVGAVRGYVDQLPVAHRVALTDHAESPAILAFVQALKQRDRNQTFLRRLNELHLAVPLGTAAAWTRFVKEDAPRLVVVIRRIQDGQRQAIQAVRARFENPDLRRLLAEPPLELVPVLTTAGFRLTADTLAKLSVQANQTLDTEQLNQLLTAPVVRKAVARQIGREPNQLTFSAVCDWLVSPERGRELARLFRQHDGETNLSDDRLVALAALARRQAQLQQVISTETAGPPRETTALSPRLRWLIGVSFLVCVVGVANAMLMSVTERFLEIATMKCLGALDGFVIQVFLFEALVQGAVGGALGVVIGLTLAVLRAFSEFGGIIFGALPLGALGAAVLGAWVVGLVLAGLAAIGPVWVAARLSPMEAMRVE
jgi:putative ABC transport system permease protein